MLYRLNLSDLGKVYWITNACNVNLDTKKLCLHNARIKFEHSLTDKMADSLVSGDVNAFWDSGMQHMVLKILQSRVLKAMVAVMT